MKYIIDTDPGIDDAIAIMLGVKNNLDIIGFTLASGNVPEEKSEKNLKVIQDFLETNIKMYKGTTKNNCNHKTAEFAHGIDGLGDAIFPKNNRKMEKMAAEDFIIKASKKYKRDLTIICLGPLTNLANAIRKDKHLTKRLKHVLIMGATYNPQEEKKYLEFNISVDPQSAQLVFETPFEDIKVVTHEIGVKSFIEKDYIQNLKKSEKLLSRFVSLISEKYIAFTYEDYGIIGLATPDPTTISSLIDPNVIQFSPCEVEIITEGDNKGECNVTLIKKSNILISTDFNLEKFRNIFKNTFN